MLVCNHVSFVDAVLLMAASPRPIRFIMDHRIFQVPVLGWLFKLAKAIPIAPQKEDPAAYEAAFDAGRRRCCAKATCWRSFPRARITRDGELQPFKGGVMKILERARAEGIDVPVIPMALTNLWGSYFSRVEVRDGENVAMVRAVPARLLQPRGLQCRRRACARPRCSPKSCSGASAAAALMACLRDLLWDVSSRCPQAFWHAVTWLGDSGLLLPAALWIAVWLGAVAAAPGRRHGCGCCCSASAAA